MRAGFRATWVLVGALSVASGARGAGPLGPSGSRIRTSAYAIDLAAGPPVLSTRPMGLGAAYVAIAEGTDGNLQNPAAPAVRTAHSLEHVDYDLGVTLLFPSTLATTDYFNTGRGPTDLRRSDQSEFFQLAPMANFQIGAWGFGVGLDLQRYGLQRRVSVDEPGEEELVRAQISTVRTYLARSIDDGQLVAGLGFHVTAMDVTTRDEILTRSGNVFSTRGVNLEGGVLFRPTHWPYRLGFALRAPVLTEVDARAVSVGGDVVLGEPDSPDAIYFPRSVRRPWSADVGVAVQIGARPLNPPWVDPVERARALERWQRARQRWRRQRAREAERAGGEVAAATRDELAAEARRDEARADAERRRFFEFMRRRYEGYSRRYVLLSAALHADGRVGNAVGIESFLQQTVDRSGERVTLSPRLGLESEPIPHRLKARGGTYLEPSRFRSGRPRLHSTLGLDAAVFDWTVFGLFEPRTRWRVGGAVDLARSYLAWGVSLGVWH